MKRVMFSLFAMIALAGAVTLATGSGTKNPHAPGAVNKGQARTYKVDPAHAAVYFKIRHLNTGTTFGRFNEVNGSWTLGPTPATTTFAFSANVDSIDTGNKQRDDHLKNVEFFNAEKFPTISFKSTSVVLHGDHFDVTGDLTMHGKTKAISIHLAVNAEINHPLFGKRNGIDTEFVIKRSDFGMDKFVKEGIVGDEVTLMISIEGLLD